MIFSCFIQKLKEKVGGLLGGGGGGGGGGAKGYVGPAPPLKLLGGAWPPLPPSSYAYDFKYMVAKGSVASKQTV